MTEDRSLDDLVFGLTASLWPLRLQQAATAAVLDRSY